MKMIYNIYLITNKVNGKKYIGYTKNTIINRFQKHIKDSNGKSKRALSGAIKKYGKESFMIEQLGIAPDHRTAQLMEILLIASYKTLYKNGYNMTKGGDGGGSWSEESKEKVSKSNLGKIRSKKAIENNRKAQTGRKHSMTTIEKMKGRKPWNKGKITGPHSLEHNEKISRSMIGINVGDKNPMYGKTTWNKGKKS